LAVKTAGVAASTLLAGFAWTSAQPAAQGTGAGEPVCRITGRVAGLGVPLPGAAITAQTAGAVRAATSTGEAGTYRLTLPPGQYVVSAELTGFSPVEQEMTLGAGSCDRVADLTLTLAPRQAARPPAATAPGAARARPDLVQAVDATSDAVADFPAADEPELDAALLLPPGFASEATSDAIAVTGDAARLDRGLLDDRQDAIARGELALAGGDSPPVFGPGRQGAAGPGGGRGAGPAAAGAGGGRGAGPGGFGRGGGGGRDARLTTTADYTFGGSVLDSSPYQLRSGTSTEKRPYTQQNFGLTIGGPLRIPGVYDGTQRTNFTFGYNGGRGRTLFDRYATVPTAEMRAGDLSTVASPLVDPLTGQPFPGNRIPADRISPQASALMQYIPLPNLPGDTRNYHHVTPTASVSDSLNVRLSHNFAAPAPGAAPLGRGGGGGGRGGRAGGQGRGTNVTLTAQLQYRRQDGDQTNVFSTLGGERQSTTLGVPVRLNVRQGRTQHALSLNASRSSSATTNRFASVQDVAALAGISGASTDPFAWGVPALSFSSVTGLRDVTPSSRSDRRVSASYSWSRPFARHSPRAGADVRLDRSRSNTESNAAGSFLFTGLYTGDGSTAAGADVADFLLGLPQQASVQYGPGDVTLVSRSMNLFLMDDWRMRSNLTLNAGVRYELLWPYIEENGRLVNLDAPEDFSAAAPVMSGETGAFTGDFPAGLLLTDANNVAPRIGLAWRPGRALVVRGGYGVSYNAGAYSSIARQLASQPPFAVTNTRIAELNSLLLLENALAGASPLETTNNFGVDKDYVLGLVQTWNVDVTRQLFRSWNVSAGFTHTRGSSLDILRAPNRDADGLRIEGVQPFLWQSSEGSSVLNSAAFRLQRRAIRGIGGQITYTLARSRDNAPSIGGGSGSSVVAQNDRDLDAEWGLSNFDRRHRLSANLTLELPFGENRRWLSNGGPWAAVLENWRVTANFTAESGQPLTPRVQAGARDAAQGVNGALRADYAGGAVGLDDPTIDEFFNTSAFSVPDDGTFGASPRNIILGPGSRQLNAQLARDVRLGGTRAVTIQLRANNVLNLVNYTAVDTSVNSPAFGQVLSVRPRRSAQLNLRFRF
jgi:hypothetical protein